MCILCVIQKWSRRIATMLPWLIIPLIGLWAFSQLLPPAFRFEITSPRLACVFVLLVTLFWYEILMPHLSSWRAHRIAQLRARKRVEAIELQKLRKTATKRCRNCLTPYKDQNPGGGRFMCSYCGHISKRPVLDMPLPPGLSNSRIKDLIGKSGKMMSGKLWSDSGWIHGHDWVEDGNWSSESAVGRSSYWRKNGISVFGGDDNCLTEKSYFCVIIFVCKRLNSFCLSMQWLWGKIFGFSSTRENFSSNSDSQGSMTKRENGLNFQESKGEKARRKAEEKRQARLEKELLEEEERKQREEVARLVEEQRRLRDEKMEAERDRSKTSSTSLPVKEKENDRKKETEKRRQERKKEKDRGSSKSNSDAEELEKRAAKESEKKFEFDRKSESDHRDIQKSFVEGTKGHVMESGNGTKINAASAPNFNSSNAGYRYLDRMRGSIWSSSKAFRGSNIFGKISTNATPGNKEEKSLSSVERVHTSYNRRDTCSPPEQTPVKHSLHIDDKSANSPVLTSQQSRTSPKKSWQQLFTGSLPVPPTPNVSVISRPTPKPQIEVCSPPLHGQSTSLAFENPTDFGIPAPFALSTYPNPSPCSSLGFSPAVEPIFSHVRENPREFMAEEPELFEDPCYIPDPVSLLGPVSESLENFQLDKGTGFGLEIGGNWPVALKNARVTNEVNKPSPFESPLSREKHNHSYQFRSLSTAQELHNLPLDDDNTGAKEKGTWQMWKSSPLGQDGLGLVGSPASWLLPLDCNRTIKDDFVQPLSQKTMASLFKKDDQALSGTLPHHNALFGNCHGDGTFSSVTGFRNDPWLQKGVFPSFLNTENHYTFKPQEVTTDNDTVYGSPRTSSASHPFEASQTNYWSKSEQTLQSSGEGAGKPSVLRPSVGGLFPTPDLQSPWSFD